jgi:hypothetical protein
VGGTSSRIVCRPLELAAETCHERADARLHDGTTTRRHDEMLRSDGGTARAALRAVDERESREFKPPQDRVGLEFPALPLIRTPAGTAGARAGRKAAERIL